MSYQRPVINPTQRTLTCCIEGTGRRWHIAEQQPGGICVTYGINWLGVPSYLSQPLLHNCIRDSFQIYEDAGDICFIEHESLEDPEGDPVNVLIEFGPIDGAGGVLGQALSSGTDDQGDLPNSQSPILIDTLDSWPTNLNDICNILLHEIGHGLGLDHSGNLGDVMFANYQFGTPRWTVLDASSGADFTAAYPDE